MIRLDKFLAEAGVGTRTEVKKLIKAKKVTVDGVTVTRPEQKVNTTDAVSVAGKEIVYEIYSYYLFYKPAGCVTARQDSMHKTVLDYFPEELQRNLSPVGRLDKDTEGLLLLTNDGAFNHYLMSPANHVTKTYYAVLDQKVPETAVNLFAEGVDIGDDKKTLPAELHILPTESDKEKTTQYAAELTICEGRFHQVKRMFAAVGCKVVYLKRIRMGSLTLTDLKKGAYRKLSQEEINRLKEEKG